MIGDQITWGLIAPQTEELPLGYLKDDDEVERYLGKEITPFQELRRYVGKRIIETVPTENHVWYRCVLINDYIEDYEAVYAWKDGVAQKTGMHDRLCCSDDNRKQKTNMWISELFCGNGRYGGGNYPTTMYEILGVDYDTNV